MMPRRRKEDQADDESPERSEPTEGGEAAEDEKKRPPRRRPRLGNPDADPVKIHREYVERHLQGGGPATPEAYEQALRQWHELPGAVSRPPAEVTGEPVPRPEQPEDETEDTGRDAEPPA
jgi:hypothetical protein